LSLNPSFQCLIHNLYRTEVVLESKIWQITYTKKVKKEDEIEDSNTNTGNLINIRNKTNFKAKGC
jgi:hypothetical protein